MRSRSPDFRTVPSSTAETPSSAPIARMSCGFPLRANADVREAMRRPSTLVSALISSSLMPSLRYSLSGSALAFTNGSADPDNEYLSDGISDELINALTKVDGLRIASRTSAFALKGKAQDIRGIGALLGVSAVLEGTVRQSGDRLRITAQLAAADDGRTLWSERYDRALDDVFAIQDEIARTIVSTLRTTFLADIADPTPQRYTHNLEAYSLYLKGRFCWNKRSQEGVLESISFFKEAIDHDPDYALAYSGLSDSYALQVDYRSVPVTEGYRLAR